MELNFKDMNFIPAYVVYNMDLLVKIKMLKEGMSVTPT